MDLNTPRAGVVTRDVSLQEKRPGASVEKGDSASNSELGLSGDKPTLATRGTLPIVFLTCNRAPYEEYIHASIASLHQSMPSGGNVPIHVVVDGPDAQFMTETIKAYGVHVHCIPAKDWEGSIRHWQIHRRIAYSYHRSFQIGRQAGCIGVLICEDDVAFRHGVLAKLGQVTDEMAHDGRRSYVLCLYHPHDREDAPTLRRGQLYGAYPGWDMYGGQAVYFPQAVLEEAQEFWASRGWRDREFADRPNDLLIGDFGESLWRAYNERGGIYACYRALVQHTGCASRTGLGGHFHTAPTFNRPWFDESP